MLANHNRSHFSKQAFFFLEVLLLPSREGREGSGCHPKGLGEILDGQVCLEEERNQRATVTFPTSGFTGESCRCGRAITCRTGQVMSGDPGKRRGEARWYAEVQEV